MDCQMTKYLSFSIYLKGIILNSENMYRLFTP